MASPTRKKAKIDRNFNKDWLTKHSWLEFKDGRMFCGPCTKQKKVNVFTEGCTNFRTTTLDRHLASGDHRQAIKDMVASTTMHKMMKKQLDSNDNALIHAMRTIYFMNKNYIAMHKYGDFVDFLLLQGCKSLEPLADQYKSHCITDDYITAIDMVINEAMREKIENAAYVSLLTDESCDITNQKKLAVYMKFANEDCKVSTSFIKNVQVADGTAETITNALIELVEDHAIPHEKVIGLGSDGASVS